ncbi:MAG: hypothetical protein ACOH1T_01030 [Microbacteriaceae bacterium]
MPAPHPAVCAATAIALLLTASACAQTAPATTPGPTESATLAPTTPEPTPTTLSEALALSCESLIGDAIVAELTASSQTMTPQAQFHQKVLDEASSNDPAGEPSHALFVHNGGVVCQWGAGLRAFELYGYSPIDATDAATQQSLLLAKGFTSSAFSPGGMLFSDPGTDERLDHFYLFTDGHWYMSTDRSHLVQMSANFPNS